MEWKAIIRFVHPNIIIDVFTTIPPMRQDKGGTVPLVLTALIWLPADFHKGL